MKNKSRFKLQRGKKTKASITKQTNQSNDSSYDIITPDISLILEQNIVTDDNKKNNSVENTKEKIEQRDKDNINEKDSNTNVQEDKKSLLKDLYNLYKEETSKDTLSKELSNMSIILDDIYERNMLEIKELSGIRLSEEEQAKLSKLRLEEEKKNKLDESSSQKGKKGVFGFFGNKDKDKDKDEEKKKSTVFPIFAGGLGGITELLKSAVMKWLKRFLIAFAIFDFFGTVFNPQKVKEITGKQHNTWVDAIEAGLANVIAIMTFGLFGNAKEIYKTIDNIPKMIIQLFTDIGDNKTIKKLRKDIKSSYNGWLNIMSVITGYDTDTIHKSLVGALGVVTTLGSDLRDAVTQFANGLLNIFTGGTGGTDSVMQPFKNLFNNITDALIKPFKKVADWVDKKLIGLIGWLLDLFEWIGEKVGIKTLKQKQIDHEVEEAGKLSKSSSHKAVAEKRLIKNKIAKDKFISEGWFGGGSLKDETKNQLFTAGPNGGPITKEQAQDLIVTGNLNDKDKRWLAENFMIPKTDPRDVKGSLSNFNKSYDYTMGGDKTNSSNGGSGGSGGGPNIKSQQKTDPKKIQEIQTQPKNGCVSGGNTTTNNVVTTKGGMSNTKVINNYDNKNSSRPPFKN